MARGSGPFHGRRQELRELPQLLARHRVVTITGPPGCGKSRLASELMSRPSQTGARIVEVDLSDVRHEDNVLPTIATAISPLASCDLSNAASVARVLSSDPTLLLLDDCDRFTPQCREFVRAVMAERPLARILVTGAAPLSIDGERVSQLEPLASPDDRAGPRTQNASNSYLEQFPAVAMFAERAHSVRPTFQLTPESVPMVVDICRALDGLPLALELASSLMRAVALDELYTRLSQKLLLLRDALPADKPRHQSMTACIDVAYELLSSDAQRLFARVSVFSGGWTLLAAERICGGTPLSSGSVLPLLAELVGRSLVQKRQTAQGSRFGLLNTLQAYAWSRFKESSDFDSVVDFHFSFFLEVAEQAKAAGHSGAGSVGLDAIAADYPNMRDAMEGELDRTRPADGVLRFAAALDRFWESHGRLAEGMHVVRRALATDTALKQTHNGGKAMKTAGNLAFKGGLLDDAERWYQAAGVVFGNLHDEEGEVSILHNLGNLRFMRGSPRDARRMYYKAYRLNRHTRPELAARNANCIADIANHNEQYQRAAWLYGRAIQMAGTAGEAIPELQCVAGMNRGVALARLHQDEDARLSFGNALAVARRYTFVEGYCAATEGSATLSISKRQWRAAAGLHAMAAELRKLLGLPVPDAEKKEIESEVELVCREGGQKSWDEAVQRAHSMSEQAILDTVAAVLSGEPLPEHDPAEIGAGNPTAQTPVPPISGVLDTDLVRVDWFDRNASEHDEVKPATDLFMRKDAHKQFEAQQNKYQLYVDEAREFIYAGAKPVRWHELNQQQRSLFLLFLEHFQSREPLSYKTVAEKALDYHGAKLKRGTDPLRQLKLELDLALGRVLSPYVKASRTQYAFHGQCTYCWIRSAFGPSRLDRHKPG